MTSQSNQGLKEEFHISDMKLRICVLQLPIAQSAKERKQCGNYYTWKTMVCGICKGTHLGLMVVMLKHG